MHNTYKKKALILSTFVISQAILIIAAFFVGYWQGSVHNEIYGEFPVLSEAYGIIKENSIKDLPTQKVMEYSMIRGLVGSLKDPFTMFVEPPQHSLETDQLAGKFGGIGARIERGSGGQFLLYPYVDSPAKSAGIQDGDQLLQIDDYIIDPQTTTFDDILTRIRGDIGSKVSVKISRGNQKEVFSFDVIRKEIVIPSVSWNLVPENPNIGLLKVNIIAATTPDEIRKALIDLKNQNVSKFIIDLRNNSGGLVDAGLKIASLFLDSGTIIQEQYRNKPIESFKVEQPGSFKDIPLIILINQGTASSAEIIAGSLQAHHRGKLIGSPSYGKDTIQLVFDLIDKSSLHVTAAKWWIPNLKFPNNGSGLIPDVILSEEDAQSNKIILTAIEAFSSK